MSSGRCAVEKLAYNARADLFAAIVMRLERRGLL